ncbi:hypothetical protein, conserved [Plasmodium gonderi]|uniref:Proteasome activator complex subunit 4 C-terminal domain-containing protein n=1 Tax=Plasmodium gonderi TaxID=77519 RepID=A0A1Y1JQF3_PLAGO|nr:hypothetical protein, conserved [Plasmodium gonderi]GAW83477.1 hypothetical protein, conserved [Plasmodium gonderi]
MLDTFRELNDYSNFLPKKIKENVNKEKYQILHEIKKIVTVKKNNSYNITLVIKLCNTYETINTTKHKSFHFYIFMIKYLWYSLQNKNISPNLKSYICQNISNILDNIKSHILDDYFFEYDRELILKNEEVSSISNVDILSDVPYDDGNSSDITNNSYADISDHYYDEYKCTNEERSDVDSTTINENKLHISGDQYYISVNGIYDKVEENNDPFLNEEIIINGKNESFRLYIQKRIFNIIDYKYLFNLFYDYVSNNTRKQGEYSHNAYKNFITSVINLLAMLRPFCYYNIDVHNLLFDFSLNNMFSIKYEEYIDKREDYFIKPFSLLYSNKDNGENNNNGNDKDNESSPFCINKELNKRAPPGMTTEGGSCEKSKSDDGTDTRMGNMRNFDESVMQHIDLSIYPIEKLELCTRYNTVFLNFLMLSQLGSDDLCFKLIKYEKVLYLYKKLKRYNWHSINYAFVRIVYKGLKYAYMYNINLQKQMKEILSLLFFLFIYYIKLPCNAQLNSAKKYIPEDYNLLINDDDSVVKTISKTFVFLLNKMYRKESEYPTEEKSREKEKQKKEELLQQFLAILNDKNFNLSNFDEVEIEENQVDSEGGEKKIYISSLFQNLDTHEFFNIITCLFMPHIHPSSVGKHLGNISLFINTFLFCFIRKFKRECMYMKRMNGRKQWGNGCSGGGISSENLSGGDISSENLSGGDISSENLSGGDISSENLSGGDISSENLSGGGISRENLSGGNISTGRKCNHHEQQGVNTKMNDYITNYFISEEDKKFVIEKFTQLAMQGMFPKSSKGVSLFENILKHICVVDINCLDIFVKKIMECLINVNISTQICNCLLSLCLILPLLIRYKANHLKDLLPVMNMGIDICDVYKSFTIFSFLSILFSYICIVKIDSVISESDMQMTIREYKQFMNIEGNQLYTLNSLNDEQIEEVMKERKELVDYLCYWIHEFFDKILYFMKFTKNEKSKDTKKLNGEKKENKVGNDVYSGLKTTIISLFIHLDHEIVYELCHKFLNNIEQENAKSLSIIPYAFGLVNNKKIYDTLFNSFYRKLITKKKKKRLVSERTNAADAGSSSSATTTPHEEEEYFVYTKNEYANEDTVKCYLQFLSSLIRKANDDFLNLEDLYKLIEIYIIEDNTSTFKYICKIMYRFLEMNFSLSVKEYSCFKIQENMNTREKIRTLAGWGIPWYILNNTKKEGNETNQQKLDKHKTSSNSGNVVKEDTNCVFMEKECMEKRYIRQVLNAEELVKWKTPSQENVKIGKNFTYFLLDYLIDLLIQCDIPIYTSNLLKYIEKRKLREKKINWKFPLNHSNMMSRTYKLIKCIIKPLSCIYPDERYNYNNLLTKCHVVNTKISFYLYVYMSEIIVTLSLHVLKIPKHILNMYAYTHYNRNDEKNEHRETMNSVNSENSVNDMHTKQVIIDMNEEKKLKDDFFTNVINKREKTIKADAKIQRKIVKCIHFLLLKCNENANMTIYNEYINSVLSFTYNMYPYSYNYDIVKSQYINNIFYLYNERLKHRKKNYSFKGYREQLCNILFFINLSIYSQVRSYAQSTLKLILPTFKIIKIPYLKICSFYLKNYIKLYISIRKEKNKDKNNNAQMIENSQVGGITNNSESKNGNDMIQTSHESISEVINEGNNEKNDILSENGSISKMSSLKNFGELNNHDYFENKCLSCFNGILINITNNSGLVKKISGDIYLLKKYIKIIINILRLEIQKDEITLKCMKLVYAIINNRFVKNSEVGVSSSGEDKRKKKSMNEFFLFLKGESEKKNNVYIQVIILSFLICYDNFVILNHNEFYFNYLLENLSIKKNVHVYNLAFYGFIKFLKYFSMNKDKGIIPAHITNVFKCINVYNKFAEVCIYKNMKSKKKSNSINAIIVNLSKIQKSFNGFSHISETHVKDFFYYYEFFKFLVNMQNEFNENQGEVDATGVVSSDVNPVVNTLESAQKSDREKNPDEGKDVEPVSSELSDKCDQENNNNFKFIGKVIHILKNLQKDVHADNEYKSTFISLICPLLFALRKLKKKGEADAIFEKVISLLVKEIAVVNMEVFNIWIYYFHLLFINIKKKYIHIYDKLFKFCLCFNFQDTSNLIFKKKTQLLNIMLIYSIHKNINLLDNNIMEFLKLIDNDNITVRQVVGDLIAYLLYVLHDNRYYFHLKCMYMKILLYLYKTSCDVIEYLQGQEMLSKQSKFIYALETLAYITITIFSIRSMYVLNNIGILFLKMFILSFQLIDNFINGMINKAINCFMCPSLYLFKFEKICYENWEQGICEKTGSSEQIGKGKTIISSDMNHNIGTPELIRNFDLLLKENMGNLFIRKISDLLNKNNWKIRNCALQFCFYFHAYYCVFFYDRKENTFLLNVFISLLVDNYIEIQNLSRGILSSVLCFYDSQTVQQISRYFLTVANQKNTVPLVSHPNANEEINNGNKIMERKKTAAIYALISVVNSYPNHVPEWLPDILISVAKMSNNKVHIIKKEIEKCIQNFLRTHKDEWEYKYKLVFTEDQLNTLDMYKGGLNYFT